MSGLLTWNVSYAYACLWAARYDYVAIWLTPALLRALTVLADLVDGSSLFVLVPIDPVERARDVNSLTVQPARASTFYGD